MRFARAIRLRTRTRRVFAESGAELDQEGALAGPQLSPGLSRRPVGGAREYRRGQMISGGRGFRDPARHARDIKTTKS